jgi:hypothetical protein
MQQLRDTDKLEFAITALIVAVVAALLLLRLPDLRDEGLERAREFRESQQRVLSALGNVACARGPASRPERASLCSSSKPFSGASS